MVFISVSVYLICSCTRAMVSEWAWILDWLEEYTHGRKVIAFDFEMFLDEVEAERGLVELGQEEFGLFLHD